MSEQYLISLETVEGILGAIQGRYEAAGSSMASQYVQGNMFIDAINNIPATTPAPAGTPINPVTVSWSTAAATTMSNVSVNTVKFIMSSEYSSATADDNTLYIIVG